MHNIVTSSSRLQFTGGSVSSIMRTEQILDDWIVSDIAELKIKKIKI